MEFPKGLIYRLAGMKTPGWWECGEREGMGETYVARREK